MLERVIEKDQVWQHYSGQKKQYKILGINVDNKVPIDYLYTDKLAKHEKSYKPVAIYYNIHQEIKLYYVKTTEEGSLKSIIKVIKEPHVVYTALYGNKTIWVRSIDEFLGKVYYQDKWINRFERVL